MVRLSDPHKLQRSYPTYWIASHRPCSWLSAINKFQEVSWGRTPQHLRARECLTIFFSDERWHVPNFDDGSRVSWQELVFDFIAEFGIVPGFVQPGMSLSKMCSKFRTYSNKSYRVLRLVDTSEQLTFVAFRAAQ